MKKIVLGGLVLVMLLSSLADAAEVKTETAVLGGSQITLHLQPFLTEADLATLRLVMSNDQALALFVPSTKGYAALAASPEDGFLKDGAPAASATALADLPDAAAASKAALAACDKAKAGKAECVLLLEIGPKPE